MAPTRGPGASELRNRPSDWGLAVNLARQSLRGLEATGCAETLQRTSQSSRPAAAGGRPATATAPQQVPTHLPQ